MSTFIDFLQQADAITIDGHFIRYFDVLAEALDADDPTEELVALETVDADLDAYEWSFSVDEARAAVWNDADGVWQITQGDETFDVQLHRLFALEPTAPAPHSSTTSGLLCTCLECGWTGPVDSIAGHPIPHHEERVAPGELAPAGECPNCGVLVEAPAETIPDVTLRAAIEVAQRRGWPVVYPAVAPRNQERHALLTIHGDVDPELGPLFTDAESVLAAARGHRSGDPDAGDGLYHVTVHADGTLAVEAFTGGVLELDPEDA